MKNIAALVVIALLGLAAAFALASNSSATHPTTTQTTGGHTPVTICHKPGTPAEQELVVDDDSVELTGHLGHGDTIGPCPSTTTTTTGTTTTTETTTTGTTTETTTTQTTTTTPPPPFKCPNGEEPIHGQDGNPGNDSCEPCAPPVNIEKCPGDTTPPGTTTEPPGTTTTPEPPTTTTTTTPTTGPPTTTTETTPVAPPPAKPHKPKHPKPPKGTPPNAPPPCPPGKPYAGTCGVEGQG